LRKFEVQSVATQAKRLAAAGGLRQRGLQHKPRGLRQRGMVKIIEENPKESRKEWMLNSFKKAGLNNSNNTKNQFWQQHNQPIEVWSNDVIEQKKNYIHQNPVKAGFVENDYEYLYSSARDYAEIKGLVNIEKI
jgi:hypothetical protein